jgi:hypothetical protein
MSRKITISKYQGNTDWSVEVEDCYGKIHHLGYFPRIADSAILEHEAEEIWEHETPPNKEDELLANAIAECVQMDIDRGVEPNLD